MTTPKSDAAILHWNAFCRSVQNRLEAGRITYGDSSFDRPLTVLIEEIRQECEDQAGWAFIAWTRLNELEEKVTACQARSS